MAKPGHDFAVLKSNSAPELTIYFFGKLLGSSLNFPSSITSGSYLNFSQIENDNPSSQNLGCLAQSSPARLYDWGSSWFPLSIMHLDDALEVFLRITELPNPSGPFPMHSFDLSKHLGPPQSL